MNKGFKEKGQSAEALKYVVNQQIRADKIFVIDANGQNLGAIPRFQALAAAEQAGLDLVQVGEKDGVPVAKLIDFGKFLYMKKKQLTDAKKNQTVVVIKEIKIRPNIGEQDYKTKINQSEQFFRDGNKVKFTLQFRGREAMMMDDVGPKLFARIIQDLSDRKVGTVMEEKDGRAGAVWSKIFYVKEK